MDIISGPNKSELISAHTNGSKVIFLITGTDMAARVEICIDEFNLLADSEPIYSFKGHTPLANMKVKGHYDTSKWDNIDHDEKAGEINYQIT